MATLNSGDVLLRQLETRVVVVGSPCCRRESRAVVVVGRMVAAGSGEEVNVDVVGTKSGRREMA